MTEQAHAHTIAATMDDIGRAARRAAATLAMTSGAKRDAALTAAANAIRSNAQAIVAANATDLAAAKKRGLSDAMLDRLMLDAGRIEAMAAGMETVVELDDPLGRTLAEWERPSACPCRWVSSASFTKAAPT